MSSIKDIYYYYLEELNRALGITHESVGPYQGLHVDKNRDASTAVRVLNEAMSGDNRIAIEKSNLQDIRDKIIDWLQAQKW